jgi:chromosome partitioning protein
MICIAIVNSKGGVGKTTLTAALAVRAAQDSDRVALVDLDPQGSLAEWWSRRGKSKNPEIFTGADNATDAAERLALAGWDWVFLDGPPAWVNVIKEMVETADFVLIPTKASVTDLFASEDAIALAREAGTRFLIAFNDVGSREQALVDKARSALAKSKLPMAETAISHRMAHITAMNAGKSASEVNGARDAAAEIDALWAEIKTAAMKAARAKRQKGGRS